MRECAKSRRAALRHLLEKYLDIKILLFKIVLRAEGAAVAAASVDPSPGSVTS
jgi:hypothetical protein